MSNDQIVPDDKDWTFVITDGCSECGFTPFDAHDTGDRLRAAIPRWQAVLARPDVAERPDAATWSPLEYGCHVRDVCEVFRERLDQMLTSTDPDGAAFQNWDQDAAAAEGDYAHADAQQVALDFDQRAAALAVLWDSVQEVDRNRVGLRSNGSTFTVDTLAVYFVHDIEHHLHDVNG